MSKADDDQQARLERAREIGLFRYMLIREAADPLLSSRQRGRMVRALAEREHTDPFGRKVRFTRWTAGSWTGAGTGSTRWSPRPASRPRACR
jgi:putative transposase